MEAREIEEMRRLEDHHWWFVGKRLLVAALLGDVLAGLAPGARPVGVDRFPLAKDYDRADQTIRLRPEHSKNKHGRKSGNPGPGEYRSPSGPSRSPAGRDGSSRRTRRESL
jgi:hypothetical protein